MYVYMCTCTCVYSVCDGRGQCVVVSVVLSDIQCTCTLASCPASSRNLGVHISKVRSITLDEWEPEVQMVRTT